MAESICSDPVTNICHSRISCPIREWVNPPTNIRVREWVDPLNPVANRSSGVEYSCYNITRSHTTLNSQLFILNMATPNTAVVALINPFPNDVRIAFQTYIQAPGYVNRERIPYEKWNRMHIHLDTPDLKPDKPTDSRLKQG